MIKINLLPIEWRPKKQRKKAFTSVAGAKTTFPVKTIAIGVGVLFLLLTLYFDFDYLKMRQSVGLLKIELDSRQPQLQILRSLESEVEKKLVPDRDFLKTNVLNQAPITQILQEMNHSLPDGIWLTSFIMNNSGKNRSFKIQGLAVNFENKTGIEQIEGYLQSLKSMIPSSQFTYSTAKQFTDKSSATSFIADYSWQAT